MHTNKQSDQAQGSHPVFAKCVRARVSSAVAEAETIAKRRTARSASADGEGPCDEGQSEPHQRSSLAATSLE
jgi:hypothetical protein